MFREKSSGRYIIIGITSLEKESLKDSASCSTFFKGGGVNPNPNVVYKRHKPNHCTLAIQRA